MELIESQVVGDPETDLKLIFRVNYLVLPCILYLFVVII